MSTIGNKEYSVEFNDSVFESQAWKKSRYEGKGLNGAQINKYTDGDITYGKTPVVRNVSRNIYIGNAIIPLGDVEATGDETLVQFPSSSYIQIGKYITINNDDSISENNYDGSDLNSKIGFYRAFYEDFPIGGDFQLRVSTRVGANFLLDNYKVFFNQGKLHQIATYVNSTDTSVQTAGLNQFRYGDGSAPDSTSLGGTFIITPNSYIPSELNKGNPLTYGQLDLFYENVILGMSQNNIQTRFFVTFQSESAGSPIVFIPDDENSTIGIGRYATGEIQNSSALLRILKISSKSGFLKSYSSTNDSQNYTLSILKDSTPSILTNLYQPEQLPSGLGDTSFIVIPSNIHPYIKDNLLYFLSQAGIDIGSSSSPTQIYIQNRQLK